MHRFEVVGERVSDSGWNRFTQDICTASQRCLPEVLAYPMNPAVETSLDEFDATMPASAVIYARSSPDQLGFAVHRAERSEAPLLIVSTGFETSDIEYSGLTLIASNADLGVIKAIEENTKNDIPDGVRCVIEEHHRPTKKDVSGTALEIKNRLQMSGDIEIVSVRDVETSSMVFGKDLSKADRYAGHIVKMYEANDELIGSWEILTVGTRSYSLGALSIARHAVKMQRKGLVGQHRILDLDQITDVEPLTPRTLPPYKEDVCRCGKNHSLVLRVKN